MSNNKVYELISHFEELCLFRRQNEERQRGFHRQQSSDSIYTQRYTSKDSELDMWSQCGSQRNSKIIQPATSIEEFEQEVYFGEENDDDIMMKKQQDLISNSGYDEDVCKSEKVIAPRNIVEEFRRRAKEEEQKYRKSFYDSDADEEIINDHQEALPKEEKAINSSEVIGKEDNSCSEEFMSVEQMRLYAREKIKNGMYFDHSDSDYNAECKTESLLIMKAIQDFDDSNSSTLEEPVKSSKEVNQIENFENKSNSVLGKIEYIQSNNHLEQNNVQSNSATETLSTEFTERVESTMNLDNNKIADSSTKILEFSNEPISTQSCEDIITVVKIPPKKDEKQYIVNELIESEKNYLQHLDLVNKHYMRPLLKYSCSRRDVDTIFTNIREIFEKSQMFLFDLQECHYNYTNIGKVFCHHRDLFEKYPKYCKNRRMAYHLITKTYKDLIKNQEERHNDKLGLNSSLLKPVQRLAKYELLLINLNRALLREGKEIQTIKNAISLIQSIARISDAMVILETIRRNPHNYRKMGAFLLKDDFKLLQPEKKEVVVFLFKKMVIFTEQSQNLEDIYHYKTFIPNELLRYNSNYNNVTFGLEYFNKKKILMYVLEAKDERTKTKWTSEIDKILWRQLEKCKIEAMNALQMEEAASQKLSSQTEECVDIKSPDVYDINGTTQHLTSEINNNTIIEAPPVQNGYLTDNGYEILRDARQGVSQRTDYENLNNQISNEIRSKSDTISKGRTRNVRAVGTVNKKVLRKKDKSNERNKKAVNGSMTVAWAMGR